MPGLKNSARIDCLNALSNPHVYHAPYCAEMFAENALKEAEKINYKKGMAGAWLNHANGIITTSSLHEGSV